MAVHTLASLTWQAVRDLPADRTIAVLPTGAIEAHGPHLPLGTDVIIADAMARAGAERLSARGLDVLVLPPLALTPAPFASEFAGTLHTPSEATTMLVDWRRTQPGRARHPRHGRRERASRSGTRPGAAHRGQPDRRARLWHARLSRPDAPPLGRIPDRRVQERRVPRRPLRGIRRARRTSRSRPAAT